MTYVQARSEVSTTRDTIITIDRGSLIIIPTGRPTTSVTGPITILVSIRSDGTLMVSPASPHSSIRIGLAGRKESKPLQSRDFSKLVAARAPW
jgi:hypothetical protein